MIQYILESKKKNKVSALQTFFVPSNWSYQNMFTFQKQLKLIKSGSLKTLWQNLRELLKSKNVSAWEWLIFKYCYERVSYMALPKSMLGITVFFTWKKKKSEILSYSSFLIQMRLELEVKLFISGWISNQKYQDAQCWSVENCDVNKLAWQLYLHIQFFSVNWWLDFYSNFFLSQFKSKLVLVSIKFTNYLISFFLEICFHVEMC